MLKHVIQHAALWEHENITQARKEEKVKFITYTFNYKRELEQMGLCIASIRL